MLKHLIHLLIIFIIVWSGPSRSQTKFRNKVYILSSIETPKKLPFWYSSDWNIEEEIEKKFKKHISGKNFQILFEHKVNPARLHQILTSEETIAIFWISHGKGIDKNNPINEMGSSGVFDYKGRNISEVFQIINSGIKLVSIIGCNSRVIFERYKAQGYYKGNLELTLQTFDKKVEFYDALNVSLINASKVIGKNEIKKNIWVSNSSQGRRRKLKVNNNFKLKIKSELFQVLSKKQIEDGGKIKLSVRKRDDFSEDLILNVNRRFVGVIPAKNQIVELRVLRNIFKKNNKIVLKSGHFSGIKLAQKLPLLDIELEEYNSELIPFSNSKGEVLGDVQNLYYFEILN